MNVIDMVAEYLRENKYDGLCLPEHGCACLLDDLAPCRAMSERCQPGRRLNVSAGTPCFCAESGTDHWHIVADEASGSDESGADAFTPLRRTAGNLRSCAAAMPNYAAATAGVMIGFAEEIEAWVEDHERGETSHGIPSPQRLGSQGGCQ
ncbi:MAG: hypothetical protein BWY92_01731 [Firmicutes bacterium ADurb.BinA052]|nr:MAG: hypothetical protein BWY92_01731 [Firmicutes bacterium ADurb.BinA052]